MPRRVGGPTSSAGVTGRLGRWWRSPVWLRPVAAIAALLVGVSMIGSTWTNWRYRNDRAAAFDVQQQELEAVTRLTVQLRDELACRSRESSDAALLEGEMAREAFRGIARYVLTGDGADPQVREAARRVFELYEQLGPALQTRRHAAENCTPPAGG